MKFRSKFNHGFTNNGCWRFVILKDLNSFKVKRAHEARVAQKEHEIHQNSLLN